LAAAGGDRIRLGPGGKALPMVPIIPERERPQWHAPWKLMRVVSGHTGWVRCIGFDPSNEWFATGAADRTIKIWNTATGELRLTLTGHISTPRGLAISERHPYLFSVGEDQKAFCWDLEANKIVRHYHGHLKGIYCCTLHPTIDLFITGGRDSSARVWDMRTKAQVHVLAGHTSTVGSVLARPADPQVITGSHDSTIRLWDLVAGKTCGTLTNHKKSVRALVHAPNESTFVSGAPDNLKHWRLPDAAFLKNFSGHNTIVNCLATNRDDVLVSGGDDGSLRMWDWKSGYCFQEIKSRVQPGSLESEGAVLACSFDRTGRRLFTCEADKTIKVWAEDDAATPETHPVVWNPAKMVQSRF
jgi:pleiotropic regulator 1